MRRICRDGIIGASALLQLTGYADAFIPTSMVRIRSRQALVLGVSKDASTTTDSTAMPSWYEEALLNTAISPEESKDISQVNDPWESLQEIKSEEQLTTTQSTTEPEPSWFEDALLESSTEYSEVMEQQTTVTQNDQLDELNELEMEDLWLELEREELQELCTMVENTYDIDQTPTKRTEMNKRRPRRYKHLFRYSPDISVACWLATAPSQEILESCGFTKDDIQRMSREYPKLLKMNAKDMVAPKMRFLVNVLEGGTGDIGNGVTDNDEYPHNLHVSQHVRETLPAKAFFKSRLENSLGPRHAYLALHGDTLPYGKELLYYTDSSRDGVLLEQFLDACTMKPAEFARLCNGWETESKDRTESRHTDASRYAYAPPKVHTAESVIAMENAFLEGLSRFAKNEMTDDLRVLGTTPAKMVSLLLDHGANYAEHDEWGSTVLHWAAGTGNMDGIRALIWKLEQDEEDMEGDKLTVLWSTCASCYSTKDQATPLHWAAAGVNHTHFGSGGHVDVCRFLLDKAADKKKELANSVTAGGNTPLMWACWSGSLDVAKMLIDEGDADPFACNEGGMTAAHWAASGGHVETCKYLSTLGLSFDKKDAQNGDGETPLDCAHNYEQLNVVDWITKQS